MQVGKGLSVELAKHMREWESEGLTRPRCALDLLVVREVHERVELLQCVELYSNDAYHVNRTSIGPTTTPGGQATVNW